MRRILVMTFAILTVVPSPALNKGDPRQRILDASHFTRIDEVDMKPWHLKVKYHLSYRNGQPPEEGTIEEWWAGLKLWKLRIESPSYASTVIENRDSDFRTGGVGPIPSRIRAIERDIVYPMPMGEDLSRSVSHTSHQKLGKSELDCVQLSEPPIPLPFPTFCFEQGNGALRTIKSANKVMLIRDRIIDFAGHAPALSIRYEEGKAVFASAEVLDLSAIEPSETLFTPSPDMKRVTDMHTVKITAAH